MQLMRKVFLVQSMAAAHLCSQVQLGAGGGMPVKSAFEKSAPFASARANSTPGISHQPLQVMIQLWVSVMMAGTPRCTAPGGRANHHAADRAAKSMCKSVGHHMALTRECLPTNLELAKSAPRINTPENTLLVRSELL